MRRRGEEGRSLGVLTFSERRGEFGGKMNLCSLKRFREGVPSHLIPVLVISEKERSRFGFIKVC